MNRQEFLDRLKLFGYKEVSYSACGNNHFDWRYYLRVKINGSDIDWVSVSYIINPDNILRLQFNHTPNVVSLFLHHRTNAGYPALYTFDQCIQEIIENNYGDIKEIREHKLNQLIC